MTSPRALTSMTLVVLMVLQPVAPALAQDSGGSPYRLGIGDILLIEVPQDEDLGGSVTIQADGNITLKRVGSVAVAGLTLAEATESIRHRLRLYNPDVDDVTVTISDYNALSIYVLGAVQSPGTYSFDESPTIWEAIRAAGGPTPEANLNVVRVISQLETGQQTDTYDLSAVFTGQGPLPVHHIGPGASVIVPLVQGAAQVPASQGVQVIGNVAIPSTVHITEPTRLLTVLMRAGSPLEDSKLDRIWWVHKGAGGSEYQANRVNLKLFLEEGSLAGNPLVYPGDSLRVPAERPGRTLVAISVILGLLLTTTTIILTVDRLSE